LSSFKIGGGEQFRDLFRSFYLLCIEPDTVIVVLYAVFADEELVFTNRTVYHVFGPSVVYTVNASKC
jgi:hypothetical protein